MQLVVGLATALVPVLTLAVGRMLTPGRSRSREPTRSIALRSMALEHLYLLGHARERTRLAIGLWALILAYELALLGLGIWFARLEGQANQILGLVLVVQASIIGLWAVAYLSYLDFTGAGVIPTSRTRRELEVKHGVSWLGGASSCELNFDGDAVDIFTWFHEVALELGGRIAVYDNDAQNGHFECVFLCGGRILLALPRLYVGILARTVDRNSCDVAVIVNACLLAQTWTSWRSRRVLLQVVHHLATPPSSVGTH